MSGIPYSLSTVQCIDIYMSAGVEVWGPTLTRTPPPSPNRYPPTLESRSFSFSLPDETALIRMTLILSFY